MVQVQTIHASLSISLLPAFLAMLVELLRFRRHVGSATERIYNEHRKLDSIVARYGVSWVAVTQPRGVETKNIDITLYDWCERAVES